MLFKKLLKTLCIVILYVNHLHAMESLRPQTILLNHEDAKTDVLLAFLDKHFTVNETCQNASNNYATDTPNSAYTCKPKKGYSFSTFVHELYDFGRQAAYDLGYQAACGTFLQQNIDFAEALKQLTEELTLVKQKLVKQEFNETAQAETINHPNLKETSIKSKNKNSSFKYFKYFGSALTGASIMGFGVYCYWLFRKAI